MATLTELRDLINSLSAEERQELLSLLSKAESEDSGRITAIQEARFSKGLFCPKCGSAANNIVRNGNYNGKQRYLCKHCHSTFMCTQDTILHRTHKSLETWEKYLDCMSSGMSIRKSAELCNLSVPTAFYWRHKILDALRSKMENDCNQLAGIVE